MSDRDKVLQLIHGYIQMLADGHIKEGLREATKEETEFGIALLNAVVADIEAQRTSTFLSWLNSKLGG